MAKVKLGLQTEIYQRVERDEYGSIRSLVKEYMKENKVKQAKCVPVNASNLAKKDKQILLAIKDLDGKVMPSKVIHVSTELSNEIRAGITPFVAIADFPVIHHVNNTNQADYPMVVRPTAEFEIPEEFADLAITESTETVEYKREIPNIKAILKNMTV